MHRLFIIIDLDDYKVSVSLSVPKTPFESTTTWVNFLKIIIEKIIFSITSELSNYRLTCCLVLKLVKLVSGW